MVGVMRQLGRIRPRRLLLLAALSIGTIVGASCGSNEDRCDRACEMWSVCETWGASCWNPDYDTCYDLCLEEDDWGPAYVRCLEHNNGACCAMQDCN